MAEKSPRRLKLEESLRADPADPFLRYGVALQCLREGDVAEGRRGLLALLADRPDEEIASYLQLGQSYAETEEFAEASRWLRDGIVKARAKGDGHAAAEMQGILDSFE